MTRRARLTRVLAATALAWATITGTAPIASAGTADQVASFLGDARGSAAPLTLGDPVRRGDEVVLTSQVLASPQAVTPTVLVVDDTRSYPARVTASAARSAPGRTVVLAMDSSGSMAGAGLEAARRAGQAFADTIDPTAKVGLVSFADRISVLTKPGTDRAALSAALNRLTASGETALYSGVTRAARLAGRGGSVVVLSDGANTVPTTDLAATVATIKELRTHVDAIAFKNTERDQATLATLANAGGGRVLTAQDAAQLAKAFATAAAAVPRTVTIRVTVPPSSAATRLTVATLLGGQGYRGDVTLPAVVPAPQTAANLPVEVIAAPRPPVVLWIVGMVLAALFALALLATAWPRSRAEIEARRRRAALGAYAGVATPEAQTGPPGMSPAAAGVLQLSEQFIAARGQRSAIALRLDRAGSRMLPHEWVVLRTCIVVVTGAALLVLVHPRWLGLLLGLALGWIGTEVWLRVRQSRRCRAFADQLPDTLQLLAGSLRSGFSLQQAMTAAQHDGAPPMATELGRALAAARIGSPLEDELEQIAVRMRSEDWRMAVMAIRINRSVGGNLADVLSGTARTLRDRASIVRQVRALSAEGRLSAYILMALPIGVGLFLFAIRRAYLEPLWTTPMGLAMLIGGTISMLIGFWWMLKAAKVEV